MIYKHFDFVFSQQDLLDLYLNCRHKMVPLDLNKAFNRAGYQYDESTNPNWLDVSIADHHCIHAMVKTLNLDNIDHVISLSELPVNYHLSPHKDIGRKCVLIVPIFGYQEAVFFDSGAVYFNNQCLLIDSTVMHWINAQSTPRVGLQFSFKKSFKTMVEHFTTVQN